ncbi:hypothetical protein AAMO2058_000659600 [Amorphochlora amoebiformis]
MVMAPRHLGTVTVLVALQGLWVRPSRSIVRLGIAKGGGKLNFDLMRLRGGGVIINRLRKRWCDITHSEGATPGDEPSDAPDSSQKHKFWGTQPVPQFESSSPHAEGPIEPPITRAPRRVPAMAKAAAAAAASRAASPPALPEGLSFCNLNMSDEKTVDELHNMLYEHYAEDEDGLFRFQYSKDFLRWATLVPGYISDWFVGVRDSTEKNALVGCIFATPMTAWIDGKKVSMALINFLTLAHRLRSRRLAPVLIKEMKRRVNAAGRFQAVFTAGALIPKPVATTRYYHRLLNTRKLLEVEFARLLPGMTPEEMEDWLSVGPPPIVLPQGKSRPKPNEGDLTCYYRPMIRDDIPTVHRLLHRSAKARRLSPLFTKEEIEHHLLPRENLVWTYVAIPKSKKTKPKITGFISFYSLPSTILNTPKSSPREGSTVRSAYCFYAASATQGDGNPSPGELLETAVRFAKAEGFDVLNSLEILESAPEVLEKAKFVRGDVDLYWYLYNWQMKNASLTGTDIGIIPL